MSRLDQLRLRDLLILETLAELGTMRATAERLHLSQPAISQIIRSLEEAMGVALFVRERRGVRLTEAGVAALAHLRVARQSLLAAHEAARQPRAPALRLGALPLAMLSLVPRALARLRAAVPGVEVFVVEQTVAALWRHLNDGRLDAIVSRLPSMTESTPLPPGIAQQSIGVEKLVLAAPLHHPLANRRQLAVAELAAQDWILPASGSFTRLEFDKRFLRAGVAPPRPVITCTAFHSSLQLAAANTLLTVAPASAVSHYARALRLRALPVAWDSQESDVVFACREASLALPAVRALRDGFLPG